jgi:hypothetical protein
MPVLAINFLTRALRQPGAQTRKAKHTFLDQEMFQGTNRSSLLRLGNHAHLLYAVVKKERSSSNATVKAQISLTISPISVPISPVDLRIPPPPVFSGPFSFTLLACTLSWRRATGAVGRSVCFGECCTLARVCFGECRTADAVAADPDDDAPCLGISSSSSTDATLTMDIGDALLAGDEEEALGALGRTGEDVVRKFRVDLTSSRVDLTSSTIDEGIVRSLSAVSSAEIPEMLKGNRRGGGAAITPCKPKTWLLAAALVAALVALLAAV